MAPTITKGAFVIGDETAYQDGVPQRNDIVVLYPPISTNDPFVKRVVAVPGDTFELLDGKLIINGRPAPEPYLSEKTVYQMAVRDYNIYVDFGSGWRPLPTTTANMPSRSAWVKPDRIPNGYYITLGDNRNDSEDSHIWGFAQMAGRFSSGLNRGQNARSFVKVVKVLRAD
jgi:signal peptidase I